MTTSMAPVMGRPRETSTETLDVTVLAGGPGVEREVSLNSGQMVADAATELGHRVSLRDIQPADLSALEVPADLVFIALHGTFGEDGVLQDILERRGIAYSGSDAASSAKAMDKVATKAAMIEHGIPTPRFDLVKPARIDAVVRSMNLPVVVKPQASGSSVDTHIVRDRERLEWVLGDVVGKYGAALVEEYIAGPELTVGILESQALPVCQIRTRREFYDYQAKYLDDDTEYLFDIDLPRSLLENVQALSLRTFEAVGCRDFARIDWMVDAQTLEPYAIEVNTIPGFTSHSLLPKAAARQGIGFVELIRRIVSLTLRRARRSS